MNEDEKERLLKLFEDILCPKCPKCNHKYLYNLKLDDIKEVNSNKNVQDKIIQYEFLTYVVCKNPLCNYDIELKGYVFEYPENTVDSVELIKLK